MNSQFILQRLLFLSFTLLFSIFKYLNSIFFVYLWIFSWSRWFLNCMLFLLLFNIVDHWFCNTLYFSYYPIETFHYPRLRGGQPDKTLFNLGIKENFRETFGSCFQLAILPVFTTWVGVLVRLFIVLYHSLIMFIKNTVVLFIWSETGFLLGMKKIVTFYSLCIIFHGLCSVYELFQLFVLNIVLYI